MYRVKIEQFEGPFDLLLEIIEAKKIPLVEVSLSSVTDQFLDYIGSLAERSPEDIIDFLVVASRLALLKSRELVPSERADDEEEGSIEELRERLRFYYVFRKAAKELRRVERKGESFYSRPAFSGFKSIFFFPPKLKTDNLAYALQDLLKTITLPERIPQARIKDNISLQERIKEILQIMKINKEMEFSKLVGDKKLDSKLVNFLGVLELSRLGKINIKQKNNFGTIVLSQP